MQERLLITGISGFLGAHCARALQGKWDVVGTVYRTGVAIPGVRNVPMDLSQPATVRELVWRVQPDVILHTAAMTKPEQCRCFPNAATVTNVHGTAALADAAVDVGARLLYVSTDLVFGGRHDPYTERAAPHPVSHYGRTKWEGEKVVRRLGALGTTLRTSILYGWARGPHGCFLDWLVNALRGPEPVGLFTDQHRAFLFIDDAVEMIRRVIERPVAPPVLHLAGGERANRYVFGEHFCEIFGYPTTQIEPIEMREIKGMEKRPADCALNGDLFAHLYNYRARDVWNGLMALSKQSPADVFGPRPLRGD